MLSTFTSSWLIWNHKLLFVLFSSTPFEEKFAYIDSALYPTDSDKLIHFFYYPLGITFVFLFLLPPLSRGAYWMVLYNRNKMKDTKLDADKKLSHSGEEWIERERKIEEQVKKYEDDKGSLRVTITHQDTTIAKNNKELAACKSQVLDLKNKNEEITSIQNLPKSNEQDTENTVTVRLDPNVLKNDVKTRCTILNSIKDHNPWSFDDRHKEVENFSKNQVEAHLKIFQSEGLIIHTDYKDGRLFRITNQGLRFIELKCQKNKSSKYPLIKELNDAANEKERQDNKNNEKDISRIITNLTSLSKRILLEIFKFSSWDANESKIRQDNIIILNPDLNILETHGLIKKHDDQYTITDLGTNVALQLIKKSQKIYEKFDLDINEGAILKSIYFSTSWEQTNEIDKLNPEFNAEDILNKLYKKKLVNFTDDGNFRHYQVTSMGNEYIMAQYDD